VDANGAVITLVEGQDKVSFALLNDSDIDSGVIAQCRFNRCRVGTSNTQNAHDRSARFVGHKSLGRRMNGAQMLWRVTA
jgi:hypothetical protein